MVQKSLEWCLLPVVTGVVLFISEFPLSLVGRGLNRRKRRGISVLTLCPREKDRRERIGVTNNGAVDTEIMQKRGTFVLLDLIYVPVLG